MRNTARRRPPPPVSCRVCLAVCSVLEIAGTNVSTTYVTCPADPKQTLGIKLPFLVMIIKNVRGPFPLPRRPPPPLTHADVMTCSSV
jgi:hypothetical protein